MLGALTVLLVYQLIGEVIVQFAGLPIPGPVIGLLLLFLSLWARGGLAVPLRDTANGILQHLSLLFVPAGVAALLSVLDDVRLGDDAERFATDLPIVGAVAGFVVVSIATAAVVSILRSHGYRMARRATDLVIERGLLERRATVVPIDRADGLIAGIRRLLEGRSGVFFVSEVHVSRPDYFA